jgi:hypothetical protein
LGTKHGRNAAQFQALLLAQHAIGWEQLLQGRLAQHWSRLQEDYLEQNQHHLKLDRRFHSGDIWSRKRIALLWTTVRACWDHCNSDRHGTNKEENRAIRRGRLLVSIRALYTEAPHTMFLATDRDTLALPIEDTLKKSPTGLELWLLHTRNMVKLSKQTALTALQRTHKTLTSYFPHFIFHNPADDDISLGKLGPIPSHLDISPSIHSILPCYASMRSCHWCWLPRPTVVGDGCLRVPTK